MLLSTQTMGQKHKRGCLNTAFCQEANRKATLSNTVSIILENVLSTRRQQYLLQNFHQSSMYRSYHSHIPSYLHDRPRSVIIHCLGRKTNSTKFFVEHVHDIDSKKVYLKLKKHLEANTGLSLAYAPWKKCLLALVKIGLDTIYHANTFLLSSPTDPLGNGTTSLKLTYRVCISPQTPRHCMTTFSHPQII